MYKDCFFICTNFENDRRVGMRDKNYETILNRYESRDILLDHEDFKLSLKMSIPHFDEPEVTVPGFIQFT